MSSSTNSASRLGRRYASVEDRAGVDFVPLILSACVFYVQVAGTSPGGLVSPNETTLMPAKHAGPSGGGLAELDLGIDGSNWASAMAHLKSRGIDPDELLSRAAINLQRFEKQTGIVAVEPEDDA